MDWGGIFDFRGFIAPASLKEVDQVFRYECGLDFRGFIAPASLKVNS